MSTCSSVICQTRVLGLQGLWHVGSVVVALRLTCLAAGAPPWGWSPGTHSALDGPGSQPTPADSARAPVQADTSHLHQGAANYDLGAKSGLPSVV